MILCSSSKAYSFRVYSLLGFRTHVCILYITLRNRPTRDIQIICTIIISSTV